ncbi:MAG: hypothetical protein L6E13_11435 [Firmicutes bacterium]|nr:hypothetical protein [Bacillota bacterium]
MNQIWLIYRRDLEAIRQCLPLYRLEPRRLVVEYTRICHEQMRQYRRDVMNHLLSYFLSAVVESRVPVARGEADVKVDFHVTAGVEQSRMLNLHPEGIPA